MKISGYLMAAFREGMKCLRFRNPPFHKTLTSSDRLVPFWIWRTWILKISDYTERKRWILWPQLPFPQPFWISLTCSFWTLQDYRPRDWETTWKTESTSFCGDKIILKLGRSLSEWWPVQTRLWRSSLGWSHGLCADIVPFSKMTLFQCFPHLFKQRPCFLARL